MSRTYICALALVACVLVLSPRSTADTYWSGEESTNWHDDENWTYGFPVAKTVARIEDESSNIASIYQQAA